MSTQDLTVTSKLSELSAHARKDQYTLGQILGIWLAAGATMWLLGWVAYPALSVDLPPVDARSAALEVVDCRADLAIGLAMIILYREDGNNRLCTISRRFWLNHPISPQTGETKKVLWWWLIPFILLLTILEIGLRSVLVNLWTALFPFFAEPQSYDAAILFAPELHAQWVGA